MPDHNFHHLSGRHDGIFLSRDQRVYAIGDIHGRRDLLAVLRAEIEKDIANAPSMHHTVVYLGDYVDRGPDSAGVIDDIIALPVDGADSVFIKGNHEHFMQSFVAGTYQGLAWLGNGGDDTLRSYGLDADMHGTDTSLEALSRLFRDTLPGRHRAFIDDLVLSHQIGGIFFAHAGVDPMRPLHDQRAEDLMWIRDPFFNSTRDIGVVVVHGHTPGPEPVVTPYRINVDTYAWHSGHLTAAVLENGCVRFLST